MHIYHCKSGWRDLIRAMVVLLGIQLPGNVQAGDAQEHGEVQPLTLVEVISMTMQQNPRIQAAQYGVDAARQSYEATWRQSLPRLEAATSYEAFPFRDKLITPRHMDIPSTSTDMLPFFQRQFTKNVYNFGMAWSVPLFTGGRIRAQRIATRTAIDGSEHRLHQTRDDVVLDVARTYFSILALQRIIQADESAVAALEESRRIVRQALDVGKAAPVDVYRIEARLANVQQGLITARNAEQVENARLHILMGADDVTRPFVLDQAALDAPIPEFQLEQSLTLALERRPEYRRALGSVRIQRQMVGVARAAYLPNVYLNGFYRGVVSDRNSSPVDDGGIGISLSIPIFDEVVRNRIGEESARLAQAEEELEQVRLNVLFEVQSAHHALESAKARIMAAEAALTQAQESLRIEQIKLEEGKGIVNDVLDAQTDALQAQVNQIQALADAQIGVTALQRAIGEITWEP